jgi:hypothetical protein
MPRAKPGGVPVLARTLRPPAGPRGLLNTRVARAPLGWARFRLSFFRSRNPITQVRAGDLHSRTSRARPPARTRTCRTSSSSTSQMLCPHPRVVGRSNGAVELAGACAESGCPRPNLGLSPATKLPSARDQKLSPATKLPSARDQKTTLGQGSKKPRTDPRRAGAPERVPFPQPAGWRRTCGFFTVRRSVRPGPGPRPGPRRSVAMSTIRHERLLLPCADRQGKPCPTVVGGARLVATSPWRRLRVR